MTDILSAPIIAYVRARKQEQRFWVEVSFDQGENWQVFPSDALLRTMVPEPAPALAALAKAQSALKSASLAVEDASRLL